MRLFQGIEEGGGIDDRAAGGVDEERGPLHQAQLLGADQTDAALAEFVVDADHVGFAEQLLLGDRAGAGLGGRRRVEVLAPGDRLHPERLCHRHHRAA
jgi:hypothetical protein